MGKKENIPLGVRQEFDDIDYWHKLRKNRYVTLPDGTQICEYEWMKKFMHESYNNNFDRHDPSKNILQTEDQKKWARRNNNNTNRDAYNVARKMGALNALFQIEYKDYAQEKEPWEKTFKKASYNEAMNEAMRQSCEELQVDFTKDNVRAILKTYFRVSRFLKLVRRDQRNKKEKK